MFSFYMQICYNYNNNTWKFKGEHSTIPRKKGGGNMTVFQAITLMLTFGSFVIAFVAVIVAMLSVLNKK